LDIEKTSDNTNVIIKKTTFNKLIICIVTIAADPLNPDRVYAGTVSGLHVSDDKGQQWQKINPNLETGTITGIGFTSDGKTMYVFSSLDDNGVIYKSITGGGIMVKTQGQITNTGADSILLQDEMEKFMQQ
jgi:hypothetical protein